jgi:class 3 adenylate cyclase
MAGVSAEAFARGVLESYENSRNGLTYLTKAARSDLTAAAGIHEAQLGVPAFDGLEVGESTTAVLTSVFLDLNNFTRRSFWDPLDDVTQLAHAVISGFASVVTAVGGHIAGLRGDGLYAAFGPTNNPTLSAVLALGAASFALNAVDQALNPALQSRGIEPVQVRAGIDHGLVSGVRSGTSTTNEINVIGFSANFAAKCEKYANAWEIVVGDGIAALIAEKRLLREHVSSPKRYYRGEISKSYRFFDYSWRGTVGHVLGAMHELDGAPASALAIQGA